jgi:hypothetical protein
MVSGEAIRRWAGASNLRLFSPAPARCEAFFFGCCSLAVPILVAGSERKGKRFARRGRGQHATLAGVMMAPWLASTLLPCRTVQDQLPDRPPTGVRVRPSPIDAGLGGESRLAGLAVAEALRPALACSGPLRACHWPGMLRRRHGMRGQISPGVAGAGAVSFGPHVSEQLGSATRWD